MRLISRLLVLVPFVGMTCTVVPQTTQQPTITIDSKSQNFSSGQPIHVHIVLKNTTERKFTVFKSVGGGHGEDYYSISVTGPDGNPAVLTEYGTTAMNHPPIAGSKIMKHLAPGEETDEYVLISRMFDMTAAGTYAVQVSRASPLDPAVILKSNTLTISVGN